LGGVLADDMGLGKTIQTLAHLAIEKQAKRLDKPCLIVAPTSLMSNWQNETQKFTPDLCSLIYHGDKRHSLVDSFANYDLIFTTYELILRDKQMFLENEFYYVVLDEAQRIKNVKAKSTQVIMQLKADHRLCLTGTPLENHMGELWSLFHFLMPGFLGDMSTFKTLYKNPIEQYDRDDLKEKLSQRIKPFLLRRLKQDVVEELPPKTEITLPVALTKKQRDVYESIRLTMEKKVRSAISSKGFKRSQIEILEALLRLRQTCCDPRLLKMEDTQDCNSQKLEDLLSLVETLTDENRKILLFSQFTSMLKLIEDELKQRQLSYVKLTGQTKNRTEVIDKFQRGEAQIFLISLKAGGVGLNLTQADTVIHYDPWWNPAVEDQATDRSHRIGQDKPVFVYKLIAKGTVEETIQTLQQKKKKLIDSLFSTQKNAQLKLSEQELKALFQPISSSV
jgi:SNF2 family DNA or RNA helicase